MNIQQIREAVKSAFPGPKWARRVNNMSDQQVQAVYLRLKKNNEI